MVTPEEKLLRAIYLEENFSGNTLRQVQPHCCGRQIDLHSAERVRFRPIEIGRREFVLLEPCCPVCGRWQKAQWSLIS